MKVSIFASILVLFILSLGALAQDKDCNSYDKRIQYEILSDNITVRNSRSEIFLQIYIKDDRFNVTPMVKLVEAIRLKYCDFDSIAVSFFDTRKMQKLPDPAPQPLLDWKGTLPRGFYEFDKQANLEELSFREKRNDKIYSIVIEFNEPGYCVSEEIYRPESSK